MKRKKTQTKILNNKYVCKNSIAPIPITDQSLVILILLYAISLPVVDDTIGYDNRYNLEDYTLISIPV